MRDDVDQQAFRVDQKNAPPLALDPLSHVVTRRVDFGPPCIAASMLRTKCDTNNPFFHWGCQEQFAFPVVHEMPSADPFLPRPAEAAQVMKAGATLSLAEPIGHVGDAESSEQVAKAAERGLIVIDRPTLSRTIAALLQNI
jgi:hypothetical protein